MDVKREYNYRVQPRDVDFMKRATIMTIIDYIVHTAGEDADRMGCGVRHLNESNASWVLIRMGLETVRMPDEYEEIRITTWVSDITKAMTVRNFEVIDEGNNVIASAVTYWTIIDLTERKMIDCSKLDCYRDISQNFPRPVSSPLKLKPPVEERRYQHGVVYSDLDFNCHANSTKYVQWVVDTLPVELLQDKKFKRMDINFIHEARYGETLTIIASGEEDRYAFEIRNSEGSAACRLAFSLE